MRFNLRFNFRGLFFVHQFSLFMVLGTDLKIFVLVALTYYKHACLNLNNSTIWTLIS